MTTTTTIPDLDWNSIREHVKATLDGDIRPATYDEMMEAVDAVESDVPIGVLDSATDEGIINRKGEGLDDTYTFDPENAVFANGGTTDDGEAETVIENDRVFPEALVARKWWFVRRTGDKTLRAPWASQYCKGTLKKCLWNADLDAGERPEATFEKAQKWADLDESMLRSFEWIDGEEEDDDALTLELAILLTHEERRNWQDNIVLIDLDDVRDPETGDVHPAAEEILDRADTFCELSQSGKGYHLFVFGSLPHEMREFIEQIDDDPYVGDEPPKVEIYDCPRVCAVTGDHVDGFPTEVHEGQDYLEYIVDEFSTEDYTMSAEDALDHVTGDDRDHDHSGTSYSPYYSIGAAEAIKRGPNMTNDLTKSGRQLQGSNPVHGSSGGMNFTLDGDEWYCHRGACQTGGRGLQLLAIGEFDPTGGDCSCSDLDELTNEQFLELCLKCRDEWGLVNDDDKPPSRAIDGVIEVLGLADYRTARTVYDSMDASAV